MNTFEIFLTLGGVGMLIALIKFLTDRSLLIDTINFWKKQAETETTKNKQIVNLKDEKINNLGQELINLKIQLAEEKLSLEDLPFLYARLDSEARMIDFSNMYSDIWLKPFNMNPFTYKGKTSEEYWGELAKEWTRHDKYCLRSNESFIGKETLMADENDHLKDFVIYKKPGFDRNNKKVLHIFIFDDKKIIEMFKTCEYGRR